MGPCKEIFSYKYTQIYGPLQRNIYLKTYLQSWLLIQKLEKLTISGQEKMVILFTSLCLLLSWSIFMPNGDEWRLLSVPIFLFCALGNLTGQAGLARVGWVKKLLRWSPAGCSARSWIGTFPIHRNANGTIRTKKFRMPLEYRNMAANKFPSE